MLSVKLNNPILYIFIGSVSEELINGVKEAQWKRIGNEGIGYFKINDFSDTDTLIRNKISLCQREFITHRYYITGVIKVNYILDADDEKALMLPTVKERAEYYLRRLYPAGVISDAFALLNDAEVMLRDSIDNRSEVVDSLLKLQAEGGVVYILSNINSDNFFSDDNMKSIIHSISLVAILKDCVHGEKTWYSEQYFINDCLGRGGRFMAIGSASLENYCNILKNAMITKLLFEKDDSGSLPPFETDFEYGVRPTALPTVDELLSLLVNKVADESDKKYLSNGQLIELIFGRRLDLFYDMNFMVNEDMAEDAYLSNLKANLESAAGNRKFGFYALIRLTKRDGKLTKYLRESKMVYEDICKKQDSDFEAFMSAESISYKRRFIKMDMRPYELALRYLRFKTDSEANRLILKRIEEAIVLVKDFNNRLTKIRNQLEDLYNYKEIPEFFEYAADKYITENMDGFLDIYENMYRCMISGESDKYIETLKEYIELELFPRGVFKKPVDEKITKDFIDWIKRNIQYNIFLKTGGANLHSGIFVFADSNNPIIPAGDTGKFDGVSVFHGDYGGNVDILYQAGAFMKEDLYYNEYKNRQIRY